MGSLSALVLAEEWEIARFAASLVDIEYEEEAHITDLLHELDHTFALGEDTFALSPSKPRGDVQAGLAASDVRHEAEYYVGIEHHNPIELYASTAVWEGDGKLTVYDKTQGVQNVQRYVCGVFGMKSSDVRVVFSVRRRRVRLRLAPAIPSRPDRSSSSCFATLCAPGVDASTDVRAVLSARYDPKGFSRRDSRRLTSGDRTRCDRNHIAV